MTLDDLPDLRIPAAIALALLAQGATAVWWAATKDTDDRFMQQRVEHLETTLSETRDANAQVLERLARIEERVNGEAAALDRIEKHLTPK